MTTFERTYSWFRPFLPAIYGLVYRRLNRIARSYADTPRVLDVGGRKSQYTIGVPARITISELPRETATQEKLDLGLSQRMIDQTMQRRSNVDRVLFDNMTHSSMSDNSYECIVAVEVLEHVDEDDLFVGEVHRILKPGGVFFMTTPNGDFVKKGANPDHRRHYTRKQLSELLARSFAEVEVQYAVPKGMFHNLGMKPWSLSRPLPTMLSMLGNAISGIQSRSPSVRLRAMNTQHLVAFARRK